MIERDFKRCFMENKDVKIFEGYEVEVTVADIVKKYGVLKMESDNKISLNNKILICIKDITNIRTLKS